MSRADEQRSCGKSTKQQFPNQPKDGVRHVDLISYKETNDRHTVLFDTCSTNTRGGFSEFDTHRNNDLI
jgi:hypothetical protein